MRPWISLVVLAVAVGRAPGAVVRFDDFADTESLTLSGSAAAVTTGDGAVLRLTPAEGSQSGSAFNRVRISAAKFSTYFTFRITESDGRLFDGNTKPGADGIVFVVQSVSSDIGGEGQGIGYEGIKPSVGIEFDTWLNPGNEDPDSNHVGIDVDGVVDHGPDSDHTASVSPDFDDGSLWHAWIDYDGTQIEVRVNQTGIRPDAPLLTRPVDTTDVLGVREAYVGFTSGTGDDWGNHDIITWEYRDNFDPIGVSPPVSTPPDPSPARRPALLWILIIVLAIVLHAYMLIMILLWRRRRRAAERDDQGER